MANKGMIKMTKGMIQKQKVHVAVILMATDSCIITYVRICKIKHHIPAM